MNTDKLPLSCARAIRDGGIDALAALDSALLLAMGYASEAMHRELRLAIGRAMASIMEETITPAIRARACPPLPRT